MTTRSSWLALVLPLGISLGCAEAEPTSPRATVKLGAIVDRTGDIANPNWHPILNLAREQMNRALTKQKYKGLEFDLSINDSENTAAVAVSLAQQLVAEGARGLVIDSSANTEALARLVYDADPSKRLGVPLVSMAASSPFVNNPNDESTDPVLRASRRDEEHWVFRSQMSAHPQIRVVVNILDGMGVIGKPTLKISVLGTQNAFGVGYVSAIAESARVARTARRLPAPVIEGIFYIPSGTEGVAKDYDFAAELSRLKDNKTEVTDSAGKKTGEMLDGLFPDAIVDASNSGHNVNVAKNYGSTVPLLHHDTFHRSQVLEGLGNAANGHEGTSPVMHDLSPAGETFAQELKQVGITEIGVLDAQTYDAAALLMLATLVATSSLSDPSQVTAIGVRDALRKINDPSGEVVNPSQAGFEKAIAAVVAGKPINYEGAASNCNFDAAGNVRIKVTHWKVEQQRFRYIHYYDCTQLSCPLMMLP